MKTPQDVEAWIDENLAWFTKREPLFVGSTARIFTTNGANSEKDVRFGLADYQKACELASTAAMALRGCACRATRDLDTGEVGVEIRIGYPGPRGLEVVETPGHSDVA